MKLFNRKEDSLYLTKTQWRKIFLATSILVVALYVVAMIFSLCGSKYFILNYQNAQMDMIENWLRERNLIALLQEAFMVLETAIVLAFTINRLPKWYYILVAYALPLIIAYSLGYMPSWIQTGTALLVCTIVPAIEQIKDNHKSEEKKKFSFKEYGKCLLRLLIAIAITYVFQVMIYVIKEGNFSFVNHVMNLSATFIYAIEYEIALATVLFTIRLFMNREKGDSKLWTSQQVGGFSQTSKKQSLKSNVKNLTKTQRNKIRLLLFRVYLIQIGAFLLIMVLPFLLGKVLEFLVMYTAFAIVRYILGFNYSLHYKKEVMCVTVGVIVFGIMSLAVPFFYVVVIMAILMGIGLAILLHLSYKYKGMYLFAKVAKPDKYALLYTFFDGDLDDNHVRKMCIHKGLNTEDTQIIRDYVKGDKISYLSRKYNYSQRMFIYKLDDAIAKLTK